MDNIFDWVKAEENRFETEEVQIGDNWTWNFRDHIQLIFHLKNGVFYTGSNNWLRAFKNIMEPILNLAYWTEDLEVKDVVFFIENKLGRVLSFLVKKYHDEVYVKEHDLDMLFDEITESDIDYGGALVQKGAKRPEIITLNSIAFCDQTDILGGPIGFKFFFAPSKLKKMAKFGWGNEKNGADITLEELCELADNTKDPVGTDNNKKNQTPGKNIEVYIVRGDLPESWLKENGDEDYYVGQLQIIAYYTNEKGLKQGVTLYKQADDGENLLFHTSKKVYNRALGRGVGEQLLHQQVWTNFLTIHKHQLLEAAAKVPLYTDDSAYQNRNKIQDMENLEITTIEDGKRIQQVPTAAPANIQLYEKSIDEWFNHAQLAGAAFDPILGVEATSGTTFRGQERTVAQGRGLHDRRRGQRAKFIELIYRKMIIPDIVKEINRGKEFMATLTSEEMRWVADELAITTVNERITELVLKGKIVTEDDRKQLTDVFKQEFYKKGPKHILETLKSEFDDIEVKMGINIAGKQKNLANLSDKVLSIFQFVFQNPQAFQQAMQVPALAQSFEDILEFSGMNIADFSSLLQVQANPQLLQQPQPQQPLAIAGAQPNAGAGA